MSQSVNTVRANTKRHYEVTKKDLPLSCPMPDMRLWDAHPRVYLPIEKTGRATCSYCGAKFTLAMAPTPDAENHDA